MVMLICEFMVPNFKQHINFIIGHHTLLRVFSYLYRFSKPSQFPMKNQFGNLSKNTHCPDYLNTMPLYLGNPFKWLSPLRLTQTHILLFAQHFFLSQQVAFPLTKLFRIKPRHHFCFFTYN